MIKCSWCAHKNAKATENSKIIEIWFKDKEKQGLSYIILHCICFDAKIVNLSLDILVPILNTYNTKENMQCPQYYLRYLGTHEYHL